LNQVPGSGASSERFVAISKVTHRHATADF
jgi:hypothetical protein